MVVGDIIEDLKLVSEKKKASVLSYFFKTGEGEYGEGDKFLGITVPNSRLVAKKYYDIAYSELKKLIESDIHEFRLTALLILVEKFTKYKNEENRAEVIDFYLSNTRYINNWDLVDLSCYKTLGIWLMDKDKSILFNLAKSDSLWEQRIAVVTCMSFIRNEEYDTFLKIAEMLLNHKHDLIHKAVGWLLREMGKKNIDVEKAFLLKHYKIMPRTMLRYSIEKFSVEERRRYLKGEV